MVGLQDISGAPSSGRFIIHGVPTDGAVTPTSCGTAGQGKRYHLVFEPPESVGIPSAGHFGEWVQENILNPTGLNTWPANQATQTIRVGQIPGLGNIANLEVAPGSIIELRAIVHDGLTQALTETRPLVTIGPRDQRPGTGQSFLITATSNYQLLMSSASLTINGVNVDPAPYLQSGGGGPGVTCWLVPASLLSSGPTTVVFSVQEDQKSVNPGFTVAPGINMVIY